MPGASKEWIEERNKKLLEWFGGDVEAVEFLLLLSEITELWDDILDQDQPITAERVNNVFIQALLVLPVHPFYMKHRAYLIPLMTQVTNAWLTANDFEKGTKSQRALAYTLRNLDLLVAEAIVYLTQGWSRLREVSSEMWTYFAAEQDHIDDWIGGYEDEKVYQVRRDQTAFEFPQADPIKGRVTDILQSMPGGHSTCSATEPRRESKRKGGSA